MVASTTKDRGVAAAINDAAAAPVTAYSWYVLAVLTCIYSFNWIDRYVLVILLEPIKQDLGVSDTALGFLSGFAFAIVYSLAGIPVARLADRSTRRTVISISVLVWSGMTMLCGAAQQFWQLLLARLGVAVGESGCSPSAHSLISDYFPEHRRATAFSIYGLGVIAGLSFGLYIGGWANEAYGWRTALLIAAIPGPLFALLVRFTLREPPRGQQDRGGVDGRQYSMGEALHFFLSNRVFVLYAVGLALINFSGYAYDTWTPVYLMRVQHMDSSEVGMIAGTLLGISGLIGTLGGGVLVDYLGRHDDRWYLWLPAASGVVMIVFVAIFMHTGRGPLLTSSYFIASLCVSAQLAPVIAITQKIMPVTMRALSSAMLFLLVNFMGNGAGAFVAGVLSDWLTPWFGQEAIRYAVTLSQAAAVFGIVLMLLAARQLPAELRRLKEEQSLKGDSYRETEV